MIREKNIKDRFEVWFWIAAFAAAAPCLFLPIYNPDIFWHLSAAKQMMAVHSIPAQDWLSFTRVGVPWVDFEWASQILYYTAYSAAGLAGLWALKIALLLCAAWLFDATVRLYRLPGIYRAAGFAAWAAAILSRSDIRPELFSVIGFGAMLYILESRRLVKRFYLNPLWLVLGFSVWANLHAGFAYGLLLIGFYLLEERSLELSAYGVCAFVGTLLQPFGIGAYRILWRHWRDMDSLTAHIFEWRPAQMDNPWHWPYWVLLFLGFGTAAVYVWQRRKISLGALIALVFWGVSTAQHVRHGAYYATLALPLSWWWLWDGKMIPSARSWKSRALASAVILICGGYSLWWGWNYGLFRTVFHSRFVPVQAGEFLAQEASALSGRTLYHKWGWGGYLGWRLYPGMRVFQDGRYIFHDLLDEETRATSTPKTWQDFLDHYGVQIALMDNVKWRLPTTRLYPNGSSAAILRPYYVLYMPKEAWALVYWDDRTLIFARRSGVPQDWLRSREYRYARPYDDDALSDVLSRNEIPIKEVDAEFQRHDELASQLKDRAP